MLDLLSSMSSSLQTPQSASSPSTGSRGSTPAPPSSCCCSPGATTPLTCCWPTSSPRESGKFNEYKYTIWFQKCVNVTLLSFLQGHLSHDSRAHRAEAVHPVQPLLLLLVVRARPVVRGIGQGRQAAQRVQLAAADAAGQVAALPPRLLPQVRAAQGRLGRRRRRPQPIRPEEEGRRRRQQRGRPLQERGPRAGEEGGGVVIQGGGRGGRGGDDDKVRGAIVKTNPASPLPRNSCRKTGN